MCRRNMAAETPRRRAPHRNTKIGEYNTDPKGNIAFAGSNLKQVKFDKLLS
jgi:hypothetical protein